MTKIEALRAELERQAPVIEAALEWQRLVNDLDAPAAHIRPALSRLDKALTDYRDARGKGVRGNGEEGH
jgi:hypothetical protein